MAKTEKGQGNGVNVKVYSSLVWLLQKLKKLKTTLLSGAGTFFEQGDEAENIRFTPKFAKHLH